MGRTLTNGERLFAREVTFLRSETGPPAGLQVELSVLPLDPTGAPEPFPLVTDTVPVMVADCTFDMTGDIYILNAPFRDWFPLEAFLPSGQLARVAEGTHAVDVIDPATGALVRRIDLPGEPLPMTDERWEALPEVQEVRQLEQAAGLELRSAADESQPCAALRDRPETFPSVRALVSDDQGRLWVESPTESGFMLRVFGENGTLLGEAAMPDRDPAVAFHIRGSRLYLVTIDELELQSVEVWEVRGLD